MAGSRASFHYFAVDRALSEILPDWFRAMFLGQPRAQVLSFDDTATELRKTSDGWVAPFSWLASAPENGKATQERVVDVVVPSQMILGRALKFPKKSARHLDRVVGFDTLQKTPFKPDQIHSVCDITGRDPAQIHVQQWIARKSDIEALAQNLATHGLRPRRFIIDGFSGPAMLDLSRDVAPLGGMWRTFNLIAACAILGALICLWALPVWSAYQARQAQEAELKTLTAQAVALRQDVDGLRRGASERAAFLDIMMQRQTMVALLREATALLPDSVWITDFTFEADRLILRGSVKGSAAQLVLDLPDNNVLKTPRLTGPVSQMGDGRERFDLVFDTKMVAR